MTIRIPSVLLLFALVAVLPRSSLADPVDKTLSPYFVVEGASPGVEALPLQGTHADVRITGVIADAVDCSSARASSRSHLQQDAVASQCARARATCV